MPTKNVVTTYTFAEIKAIGGKPYQTALEAVKTYNTTGDWCQWLTRDINERFNDGPGKIEEGRFPFDEGEMEEWDAEGWGTCSYKFTVYLPDYMVRKGLHRKYVILHRWMKQTGGYEVGGKVGTGLNRYSPHAPLPEDIDDDIDRDIENGWYDSNPKRIAKIKEQVSGVLDALAADVEATTKYIQEWVVGEYHWRYTDEFAEQEAEGLELSFYASGRIARLPAGATEISDEEYIYAYA